MSKVEMPEDPDFDTWNALRDGWANVPANGKGRDWIAAYHSLRNHLAKPPKPKHEWMLEWDWACAGTSGSSEIGCETFGEAVRALALVGSGVNNIQRARIFRVPYNG